jgi:hypothetical protein
MNRVVFDLMKTLKQDIRDIEEKVRKLTDLKNLLSKRFNYQF